MFLVLYTYSWENGHEKSITKWVRLARRGLYQKKAKALIEGLLNREFGSKIKPPKGSQSNEHGSFGPWKSHKGS